jgi:hypothetical protein
MQKNQEIAKVFHDAWNNPDVEATDLHNYILDKMVEQGLCTPDSVLNAESVRKTFENLSKSTGFDYTNYRKRPRKKVEALVFDFGEPQQEEIDGEILEAEQEKMFVGDFSESRQEPVEF